MRVWPGSPQPLGATWTGNGVNVAVASVHATRVDLVVEQDGREVVLALPERTNVVWHGFLPDARPGLRYRLRADGPDAPEQGQRFDATRDLLDPWARAHTGKVVLEVEPEVAVAPGTPKAESATTGDRPPASQGEPAQAATQAAPVKARLPWCEVVDPAFDWQGVTRPDTPWNRTVLYEAHVAGLTRRHPDVPPAQRGTYLGVCARPVVEHLRALGVTAIELLPVHAFVTEPHLARRGFENVWGYNTIGFMAPHVGYATAPGAQSVTEMKTMVRELHRAGLEVILDVVYNHTAEAGSDGPVLSFRGLDNATYYHLDPQDRRRTLDFTGCGNTLDTGHPRGLQLLLDSLRLWAGEYQVDGFRFDLAPALARGLVDLDRLDRFFAVLQQDPLLARCKLIAEPWDLGEGGYRLGGFPPGWAEWNDQYRDVVRRVWRGDGGLVGALASRLTGSSDRFPERLRATWASVNFVTAHDGFTLADLVSYEKKHNEANGERNKDGTDANHSRAWGVEGPTTLAVVLDARERARRNLIATLAVSQGVPMLLMGDELGRSQRGNNNAYCQLELMTIDWADWALDAPRRAFLEFVRRVFALRRDHPVLRRRGHFEGKPTADGEKDVTWLRQDGQEMAAGDWHGPRSALGMQIHANATDERDPQGARLQGETLLIVINADPDRLAFRLPKGPWRELLSTARTDAPPAGARIDGPTLSVPPRALLILARG